MDNDWTDEPDSVTTNVVALRPRLKAIRKKGSKAGIRKPDGTKEFRGGDTTGGRRSAQQEHFGKLVICGGEQGKGMNLSDAYREAYNVGPNTKPETVWAAASGLYANSKVGPWIEAERARLLASASHTAASVRAEMIDKLIALTDSKDGDNVRINAIKVLGQTEFVSLFLERTETTLTNIEPDQVETELSEALKKAFNQ